MKKRWIKGALLSVTLHLTLYLSAQQQDLKEPVDNKAADTLTMFEAFRHGQVRGEFRYFFMMTNNQKKLSDYFANAAGIRLAYETGLYMGFVLAWAGL